MNNFIICPHDECTGCLACKESCSKDAIKIEYDDHGHIYPVINKNVCVQCGRCFIVCPNNKDINLNSPIEAFACWNNNKDERLNSTSGSISYILSKLAVVNGFYFVGCEFKRQGVQHSITNDVNTLFRYQGSKYVQSNLVPVYNEIKDKLKVGKKILFVGTPCQVAGVKAFVGEKNIENLYCVDLVCHGVPSQKILNEWIIEKEENNKAIKEVKFRAKKPDQYHSVMRYIYSDNSIQDVPIEKDKYFLSFVYNYTLRDSCFKCKYADIQRAGDLTISDYWGYIPYKFKYSSYTIGTSMMMVNSKKGLFLKNLIIPYITYDTKQIDQVRKINKNLNAPQTAPENHSQFWELCLKEGGLNNVPLNFFPKFPVPKRFGFLFMVKKYFRIIRGEKK